MPKRFIADRGGAAALEFALIGLPLILLLLGLIEFGRGLHIRTAVDSAADRAQRVILIDPSATAATIEAEIRNTFRAGQADLLALSLATGSASGVSFRTVTLSYPMTLILPAPLGRSISIEATRRIVTNP